MTQTNYIKKYKMPVKKLEHIRESLKEYVILSYESVKHA